MALVPAKCTQCGANIEIDNTHEAGVCKYCGTPFITEKAITNYNTYITNVTKNNFNGATINIGGGNIENYRTLARRAVSSKSYSDIVQYYKKVIEMKSNDWEAAFYLEIYSPVVKGNYVNINEKAVCEYAVKWLNLRDNFTGKDKEIGATIFSIACALCEDGRIKFLHNDANSCYKAIIKADVLFDAAFNILNGKDNGVVLIYLKELMTKLSHIKSALIQSGNKKTPGGKQLLDIIDALEKKSLNRIKNFDPEYTPPEPAGFCYIATCVYGSYDCPQVWTLRRFRDYTLDETWYGRMFIKCYYAVSPKLVKWFGKYEWFKKPWKRFLDKMVSHLNSKGIADTKYWDKY